MAKKYWMTQEGEEIEYGKLEDSHLLNILKWIERRADEGFTLRYGGGHDIEDMWYEEEHLQGEAAKRHFDFKGLAKEALRRGLMTEKECFLRT